MVHETTTVVHDTVVHDRGMCTVKFRTNLSQYYFNKKPIYDFYHYHTEENFGGEEIWQIAFQNTFSKIK